MTPAEATARVAITEAFIEHMEAGGKGSFTLEEAATFGVREGLHPTDAEALAEEVCRELLLVYLGKAWGVGPRATWVDRIRRRWRDWRE